MYMSSVATTVVAGSGAEGGGGVGSGGGSGGSDEGGGGGEGENDGGSDASYSNSPTPCLNKLSRWTASMGWRLCDCRGGRDFRKRGYLSCDKLRLVPLFPQYHGGGRDCGCGDGGGTSRSQVTFTSAVKKTPTLHTGRQTSHEMQCNYACPSGHQHPCSPPEQQRVS